MPEPDAASYLKAINAALAKGNATEHTHRPALKTFIESFGNDLTATNEPKPEECGAPDFQITRKSIPLGHIEAGLRTRDKYNPYPEEINRHFLDVLADLCFAPTLTAKGALLAEGTRAC